MKIVIDNVHVGSLKDGVTIQSFQHKHPNAHICKVTHPIKMTDLQDMVFDSTCYTPCGCIVEPDGTCSHGNNSWLLIYGLI